MSSPPPPSRPSVATRWSAEPRRIWSAPRSGERGPRKRDLHSADLRVRVRKMGGADLVRSAASRRVRQLRGELTVQRAILQKRRVRPLGDEEAGETAGFIGLACEALDQPDRRKGF